MITIKEVEWYQLDDIAGAYRTLIHTGMCLDAIGIYADFFNGRYIAIYINVDNDEEKKIGTKEEAIEWLVSKVHEKKGMGNADSFRKAMRM